MAGIRIGQLPKQSEFNMDDLLLVEQEGVTKSATIEDLKKIMKGDPGVLIDDEQTSEDTVWSSDKVVEYTEEQIQENIQDDNTSETTVWSSDKVVEYTEEQIQENIQDSTTSETTVWSSSKVDTFTGEHYVHIDDEEEVNEDTHAGFLKNFEIHGNTVQGKDLSSMLSVGDKVEGRDLYRISLTITNGVDSSQDGYEERTINILSPVQLEKTGHISDRIVCKDGVWGVDKRIDTKVIHNAKWVASGQSLTTTGNLNFDTSEVDDVTEVLMSNVPVASEEDLYTGSAFGVGYRPSTDTLRIRLIDARSNFVLNQWLQYNPIILKYPTSDRKFIPLPYDQQAKLRTFAGTTTVVFNTNIKGTIQAQVPKSIFDMVGMHTEQLFNLDAEVNKIRELVETEAPRHTINGHFSVVGDTPKGYFEDVKIKGRTEINRLFAEGSFANISNYVVQGGATSGSVANKELKFTVSADSPGGYDGKVRIIPRKDTPYTIVYSINPATSETNGYIKVVTGETEERRELITYRGDKGGTGYKTYVTVIDPSVLLGCKDFYLHYGATTKAVSDTVNFRGIMVLEGDRRDSIPVEHFDNSLYAGQNATALYAETYDAEDEGYNYITDFILGTDDYSRDDKGNRVADSVNNYCRNFIRVSPNTEYTLRLEGQSRIYFLDSRKYWISRTDENTSMIRTFTTPEDCHFIQIQYLKATVNSINIPMIMNKGNKIHDIGKGGLSDRRQILYFDPVAKTWNNPILREFDVIEKYKDGRYLYHQRGAQVTLAGTEGWVQYEDPETRDLTMSFALEVNYAIPNTECLSDRLSAIRSDEPFTDDLEAIKISSTNATGRNSYIYVNIRKDRLTASTVDGFKAWLKANPTVLTYNTYLERTYECTGLDFMCYKGKTAYVIDTGIVAPTTEVALQSSIINVVSSLQRKVAALEGIVSRIIHDVR